MANTYFSERVKSPTLGSTPGSPLMSPGAAPSRTNNALQGRITSVLSASYADLEIRDSLETLDARHIHNTPETRRNLRLEVQQELIECNGDVVRDFGQVAQQLRRVGDAIQNLNNSCAAIRAHVAAANRETGPMLDESSGMTAQKNQAETKQKILGAFTSHFILSDAELTALTSTAEPVTDAFFVALARAKKIHNDSQVLLGSENQHLGLEILEQSSKHLNSGFQKLFRWTQRELKTLDLENPQLSSPLRRALRVLAERPALFQGCLDSFAENREHVLSDAFYTALTGNISGGKRGGSAPSKAIELNAHDPLRYVSDMLAWAHAATVGEREALQMLFISDADEISRNIRAGRESQPWFRAENDTDAQASGEAFDGKRALNELVDRDLSGVLRQLRQRTEQIIHSHIDATLAYQVSNLIAFYCSIFASLLGPESNIIQTLQPIAYLATDHFRSTTRDHVANLQAEILPTSTNLYPPDFLVEGLQILKGLMKSYDTSFVAAASAEERTAGFHPVLTEAIDPYLAGCESMSRRMPVRDGGIFIINCFSAAKATIKGPSYTLTRVEALDEMLELQEANLKETVLAWFVAESGMQELVEALTPFADASTAEEMKKVSLLDVLQSERLGESAQRLDAFLPTAIEDARAFVEGIEDQVILRRVVERAADGFTENFEMVERILELVDEVNGVHQPNGKEDDEDEEGKDLALRDIFPRTSEEIKVLLS